jgi:hypothetical protein
MQVVLTVTVTHRLLINYIYYTREINRQEQNTTTEYECQLLGLKLKNLITPLIAFPTQPVKLQLQQ